MTVASYGMVLCGNSDDMHHRYRGKIEKVKFGVPINEAFAHDIPATLLVLLLKVNKEGPAKKDIWRAPGNQAQVRKLSQIMQHGRLVNISNFSVYTAASVIKKFLSKLPGGIFGRDNEESLFNSAANGADIEKQRQVFYRIFCSLPVPSQHLLVLLFGTFKIVAESSDGRVSSMNPNAIAISVAPSIFHSCIHDGRQARVEDLQRFKLASQIVCTIITSFGDTNLFPRECYEFYARITGRTLRVDENWTFSFQFPSMSGCFSNSENLASEYENAPTSSTSHYKKAPPIKSKAKSVDPDRPYQSRINNRLSSSVGEVLLEASDNEECDLEPVRPLTACAGDNSLSYLHMVHENQARRLKSRSAWFLCSENVPSATSWKSVSQMPIRSATTPERMIESSKLFEPILSKETTRSRAPLGESTFGAPLNTSSAENAQPSMDRRRSWKTQMKAFSQHPSHSLDCTETEETGSPKLRCHAVSVEADTWLTDVVAFHQAPKKRKSLKKKMSTQF